MVRQLLIPLFPDCILRYSTSYSKCWVHNVLFTEIHNYCMIYKASIKPHIEVNSSKYELDFVPRCHKGNHYPSCFHVYIIIIEDGMVLIICWHNQVLKQRIYDNDCGWSCILKFLLQLLIFKIGFWIYIFSIHIYMLSVFTCALLCVTLLTHMHELLWQFGSHALFGRVYSSKEKLLWEYQQMTCNGVSYQIFWSHLKSTVFRFWVLRYVWLQIFSSVFWKLHSTTACQF